jgi:hypothetical protein
MDHYYHAGSQWNDEQTGEVRVNWSDNTRRSKDAAEREARKMAKRDGEGHKPVVEYWAREHGLRPGWDCAAGAYDVEVA